MAWQWAIPLVKYENDEMDLIYITRYHTTPWKIYIMQVLIWIFTGERHREILLLVKWGTFFLLFGASSWWWKGCGGVAEKKIKSWQFPCVVCGLVFPACEEGGRKKGAIKSSIIVTRMGMGMEMTIVGKAVEVTTGWLVGSFEQCV